MDFTVIESILRFALLNGNKFELNVMDT